MPGVEGFEVIDDFVSISFSLLDFAFPVLFGHLVQSDIRLSNHHFVLNIL